MTLACIIPARYNSTRFPGKLLAKVQRKTILQRTYENALRCPDFHSLHIATDDERIALHAEELGAKVLWTSSNPRDGTERAIEALTLYPFLEKTSFLMVLQGDHPCTPPETMASIARVLRNDKNAVVSTAAAPIATEEDFHSPHVVKCVFDINDTALYFSRAPIPYQKTINGIKAYAHIGIYCYRTPFLHTLSQLKPTWLQVSEDLEQLKVLELGYRIKIAQVDKKTPSVDTPCDLIKLENYLNNFDLPSRQEITTCQ